MGEWFDYELSLPSGKSLGQMCIDSGYGELGENNRGQPVFVLDLAKIRKAVEESGSPEAEETLRCLGYYKANDGTLFQKIHIGFRDSEDGPDIKDLWYCNKWSPNLAIATAISILFPNELLKAREIAPYFAKDYTFYLKNGELTNKVGEKLINYYFTYARKRQVKELPSGDVKVSFPIGEDSDKWGSIIFSKNDVEDLGNLFTVYFCKDSYKVKFREHEEEIPVENLIGRISNSRDNFRVKMAATVYMDGLSSADFAASRDFFVVKFPIKHPEKGIVTASMCVSLYDKEHFDQTGSLPLGEFGKERSVMYIKDGQPNEKSSIRPADLVSYRNDFLSMTEENLSMMEEIRLEL